MKLRRISFRNAAKVPLSEDDRFVLNVIFQSRLRTWSVVFAVICGYLCIRALPALSDNDPSVISAGTAAILLIGLVPAAIFFWKHVWAYRRDLRCGYKYVVFEEVIGKQYFPHTDQYFLSLSDVNYMHHEVEPDVYRETNIGDRYAVYFAACSRYPFTLRARITVM